MSIKLIVSLKRRTLKERNTATLDVIQEGHKVYVYINYGYSVYKFTLKEWYEHCIIGNQ